MRTQLMNHGSQLGSMKPAFQLPPPPPGMRWHREDGWKSDDLPSGYRPLVEAETRTTEDEMCEEGEWREVCHDDIVYGIDRTFYKSRTTRPLTFEHAGKTWTWHKPGDPMPCDGEKVLQILLSNGEANRDFARAKFWDWKSEDEESDVEIVGWRYTDEKKTVPLGPEDVRCGDEIQDARGDSRIVGRVSKNGVDIFGLGYHTFEGLIGFKIRRRGSDAWEPCSKEVPA